MDLGTEMKEIGQSVEAMGLQTNYHDYGEGEPIILIHGSGAGVSAWANWRGTIPQLAKSARAVAYDVAGFGFTELDPEANYTIEYWLEHLTAFLDALGLEKVSFVGNSFGGTLAAHFALQSPERVSRMAMMGANLLPHEMLPDLDRLAWGYEPSPEMMRELLLAFPYDQSIVTDELVQARFEATNRPDYQAAFRSMFPPPRQRWVNELAPTAEQIATIDCEVLMIHGREDRMVPVDVSIDAARIVPRAELHIFGHCGHWVQMERPREFMSLIQSFFFQT
ncbi:MAG: alpha/beta hydrolase [Parasphingopyxis sp.]|uniref:alpha/beta fold hydrolase n=1 Tax=Parasphingopyxis sp. TaxID=1920299 RepID=UPI0032EF06F6